MPKLFGNYPDGKGAIFIKVFHSHESYLYIHTLLIDICELTLRDFVLFAYNVNVMSTLPELQTFLSSTQIN